MMRVAVPILFCASVAMTTQATAATLERVDPVFLSHEYVSVFAEDTIGNGPPVVQFDADISIELAFDAAETRYDIDGEDIRFSYSGFARAVVTFNEERFFFEGDGMGQAATFYEADCCLFTDSRASFTGRNAAGDTLSFFSRNNWMYDPVGDQVLQRGVGLSGQFSEGDFVSGFEIVMQDRVISTSGDPNLRAPVIELRLASVPLPAGFPLLAGALASLLWGIRRRRHILRL